MKKRRLIVNALIAIALGVVIVVNIAGCIKSEGPERYEESKWTKFHEVPVSYVYIEPGKPHVRSTSRLTGGREDTGNSYGQIVDKDDDGLVLFSIKRIIISDADEVNGPYIGIYVDDLSEKELKFFPKGVKNDPDGIIWISSKYISWIVNR